jgi:hypothetical protein
LRRVLIGIDIEQSDLSGSRHRHRQTALEGGKRAGATSDLNLIAR